MSLSVKSQRYRELIDELVRECHEGQGQIAADRVLQGLWNANTRPDFLEDQHEANAVLAQLSDHQRRVLARLFTGVFESGVFSVLKTLEWYQVRPFDDGYEGGAGEDFIGRLNGWDWPDS